MAVHCRRARTRCQHFVPEIPDGDARRAVIGMTAHRSDRFTRIWDFTVAGA
jgi:hypothetical protein